MDKISFSLIDMFSNDSIKRISFFLKQNSYKLDKIQQCLRDGMNTPRI